MAEAIFEELEALEQKLKTFPAGAHWFCPKRQDDDDLDYDNPNIEEVDISISDKQTLISAAHERQTSAYQFCLVFALSVEEAGSWQRAHMVNLTEFLTKCDTCVRNYHMGRRKFLKELSERFEEDIVIGLADRINDMDFERIDKGLYRAESILKQTPESGRTMKSLQVDPSAIIALYEALCCSPYHSLDERLSVHFDAVFNMIQTNRILKLGDILPAMTRFLFSSNQCRREFASNAWRKYDKNLTPRTFEWVVQDSLIDAIRSASIPGISIIEVQRFWEGLLLILDKHDKSLITHSLRGMEVQPDVYHLALQHCAQYDSDEVLNLLIKVIRLLLEKSPQDFWAAYGSISPVTVTEQILNNKAFNRLLARLELYEVVDEVKVPYALAWISPLVQSLPPAQQFEPCRLLLHHLLERIQATNISESCRLACFRAGLDTLLSTLTTFTDKGFDIDASTSFIVISNILSLVGKYKDTILDSANLDSSLEDDKEVARLGMAVIRNSLSLHCKYLHAEFQALNSKTSVHHGMNSEALPIWHAVLESLNRDRPMMARNVLIGTTPLIGLERFKPDFTKDSHNRTIPVPLSKGKVNFNSDFSQVIETISRILERLSEFRHTDLQKLCDSTITAYPLFGALTPPDQEMYEAAVELLKTITGQAGRKEAIAEILRMFMSLTLSSLAYATQRISGLRTFAALPYFIKTSRDVLDSLCDSQDGILRTRSSPTIEEQRAITTWWTQQWQAINIAFGSTEQWSIVNDKEKMTNFCRDAMEYAEALFDQYSVLATVLGSRSSEKDETSSTSRKNLLEQPRRAMDGMSKWLRLKDPYLLSTVVSLVSKILRRLGEFDMEVGHYALEHIEKVAKELTKTNLTLQQKSELLRALEEHQGVQMIEKPKLIKKQSTIDMWSKSANGVKYEPVSFSREASSDASNSDDFRSLTRALDKNKPILDMMRARQTAKPSVAPTSQQSNATAISIKQSREKAKEEKKLRDAASIAKARALRQPATVSGEGSGLKGLGVQGKEHTPVRGEIMVSSDEESADDDSGLKAIMAKNKEVSKKLLDHETSRRKALTQYQQNVPVRKIKIIRSAKDMRARLAPSMEPLHTAILGWDIFHNGEDPPGSVECQKVPDTFQSPEAYRETFEPLLISEAWRAFATAKEENNFKSFEIKIVNRLTVDRFMEVSTTMPISDNRDNNVMEGDIILLSKGQDPLKDRHEKHCLARVHQIKRKKDVLDITYRIRGHGADPALLSALSPNLKIRGLKITSMTTIEREYAALSSLKYYDLCEEILSAAPSPLLKYTEASVTPIKQIYGLNTGQAKAVRSVKENDAFTLIQGPPGSGKTKTIIAMVGALLTNSFDTSGVAIKRPGTIGPLAAAPMQKKLLVCAPSNAAVDELVVRLKGGVKTLKGEFHKINVIRLGRSDAINSNVKDVTLDELVRAKMEGDGSSGKLVVSEREKLHQEAGRLKEELSILRPKLEEARTNENKELERRLQRDFDGKKRDQARIGAKIDENKDNGNTAARENEIHRRKLQQEIIDSAHVLCATLSGSGHDMFANISVEFETVIIDEAAQSIELSALIPLKYGCSKCILVGDPKQLPPTVLSRSAASYGYEQSLFVRMQGNHPADVHLLDTQYRMHPEISLFPSTQFYDSKLVNGENMAQLRHQQWHTSDLLGPYRFFDVKGTQTSGARGHSFINVEELNVAMQLYHRLRTDYKSYDFRGKVGIITPYKAQLRELRSRFQDKYGETILEEIDFNTTDAFQGREAEIIIFSCVRARATGGIGFLQDIRRMNVGLTRAKSSLWVLGDSQSLNQGEFWAKLISDAKARHRYTEGNILELLKRPTSGSRKATIPYEAVPILQQTKSDLNQPSTVAFRTPKFAGTADSSSTDPNRSSSTATVSLSSSTMDVEMIDAPETPSIKDEVLPLPDKSFKPVSITRESNPVFENGMKLSSVSDRKVKRDGEIPSTPTINSAPKKIDDLKPLVPAQGPPRRPMPPGNIVRKRPASDPLLRRPPPKRPNK